MQTQPPSASASVSLRIAVPPINRYRNAYRVAVFIIGLLNILKAIGIVIGVIIYIWLSMPNHDGEVSGSFLKCFIGGGAFFLVCFVLGSLVATAGQILRATLDTAVYACPFLNDDEKFDAMRI